MINIQFPAHAQLEMPGFPLRKVHVAQLAQVVQFEIREDRAYGVTPISPASPFAGSAELQSREDIKQR